MLDILDILYNTGRPAIFVIFPMRYNLFNSLLTLLRKNPRLSAISVAVNPCASLFLAAKSCKYS